MFLKNHFANLGRASIISGGSPTTAAFTVCICCMRVYYSPPFIYTYDFCPPSSPLGLVAVWFHMRFQGCVTDT